MERSNPNYFSKWLHFFLIFILRSIEKATAIRSFAAMARPHNQLQYIL